MGKSMLFHALVHEVINVGCIGARKIHWAFQEVWEPKPLLAWRGKCPSAPNLFFRKFAAWLIVKKPPDNRHMTYSFAVDFLNALGNVSARVRGVHVQTELLSIRIWRLLQQRLSYIMRAKRQKPWSKKTVQVFLQEVLRDPPPTRQPSTSSSALFMSGINSGIIIGREEKTLRGQTPWKRASFLSCMDVMTPTSHETRNLEINLGDIRQLLVLRGTTTPLEMPTLTNSLIWQSQKTVALMSSLSLVFAYWTFDLIKKKDFSLDVLA